MQKPTSPASALPTPIRVVVVTMDSHLSGAVANAVTLLQRELPGLQLMVHAADQWSSDEVALAACHADIARGDIIIAAMLFLDDHIRAVLPALAARRDHCDALLGMISGGEVMKLTRIGKFRMDGEATGVMGLLKRLRGSRKPGVPTSISIKRPN